MTNFRYKLLIFHGVVKLKNIKLYQAWLIGREPEKEEIPHTDMLFLHEIIASDIKLNGWCSFDQKQVLYLANKMSCTLTGGEFYVTSNMCDLVIFMIISMWFHIQSFCIALSYPLPNGSRLQFRAVLYFL